MIHFRAVAYVLGQFLVAFSVTMLVPMGWGWLVGSDGLRELGIGFFATLASGAALVTACRTPRPDLSRREGLLLTVAIWLGAGAFGGLPFYLSPYFPSFTDAFFEATSGFTTTGATTLAQVEVLPQALQFWRCFSHWLGGMGIVLLGIAVLPLVGHGGMQLYRAEFSGASSERLRPRIRETALSLWKIYVALTLLLFLSLWLLGGMSVFDALCHTFSTLGTGGFSTRTASVAAFNSPLIEYIIIVFMLLAGMSFIQHYRLWVERDASSFFGDVEVRSYLLIALGSALVIAFALVEEETYAPVEAARAALFQVSSILTTTGFSTADFELWHPLPQLILLALMFVGGCTGSTAGGMKTARIVLLGRVIDREFKRMVERRGVFAVRLGGQVLEESTVQSLLNLVYLAFIVNFVSCLVLAAMGVDVLTSISAVAAAMFNIGPGLGSVGPAENYGHLPAIAKWVLSGCMIAGRLEFYTVLVILTPAFWRR